jgi:hypothetical protein
LCKMFVTPGKSCPWCQTVADGELSCRI